MKTSPYFIDDTPLQILFLDKNIENGRVFFNSGLGNTWFDYDLHMIEQANDAISFLELKKPKMRVLDLCFISNASWNEGGKDFVEQIRARDHLALLPIYCIASCAKKIALGNANCMDKKWRMETNCDQDAQLAFKPFSPYLATDHPARLNGVLCGNNISSDISSIINSMSSYWFGSTNLE